MEKTLKFSSIYGDTCQIPSVIDKIRTGYGYVSYGEDNKLPDFLYNNYEQSAVLQSIINGTADFVLGDGSNYNDDLLKHIIIDYLIFGGFCLEVVVKDGKTIRVKWLDFLKVRRDENENKVFYSNKWGQYGKKYYELNSWTPDADNGVYAYYFKGHKTRGIYPIPMYIGALRSIVISTEISKFHLNNIMNGFSGNFVINFNNGQPDIDTQNEIERALKDKFTGSENAGKFLVTFNDDQSHAVTFERLADDDFDKKYEALYNSTIKEIFIAFRAQPQLFGMVIEGSLFNKEEYEQAYALYNKAVVTPIQNDIIRVFSDLGISLTIKSFNIYGTDNN